MTTWLVTRHPGALDWMLAQGLRDVQHLPHLDPVVVGLNDVVVGTLPVHLAAAVCARGARYVNLSLDLPLKARGCELSAADLERYGARLEAFVVRPSATEPLGR